MKKYLGLFLISGVLLTGCSEKNNSIEDEKEVTSPPAEVEKVIEPDTQNTEVTDTMKDLSIEDKVKNTINETLREATKKINNISDSFSISEDEGAQSLVIVLNGSDSFTSEMIKKGIWMDSVDLLEPLSTLGEFDSISMFWNFPLTDTYGNQKDTLIMSFDIDKETLDQINWDNFSKDKLTTIVNNYFEHTVLQE